ncbi:MAG TPA: chemotaxis response regulator protein-glutamate methylesterase [Vicinamibacterales bacterium]
MTARPTRVLIVDDSAIVRKMLGDALRREPDIEVVGGAADPFVARDMILRLEPDVLTLDVEMPRMDGVTFLRKLMAHRPMPVIIVSSVTTSGSRASLEALRAGAVEVIAKPGGPADVAQVTSRVVACIRGLRAGFRPRSLPHPGAAPEPARTIVDAPGFRTGGLLVIGASTGGTQAIETLLTRLPPDMPPICITQHMPPKFTRAFAERLDGLCALRVVEATHGQRLQRGTVFIAPGDYHLRVERFGLELRTHLDQDPPVCHQRPSVDVLFHSAARLQGLPRVGVLLTGMGSDGADGMVALRSSGAETIAEDERSCVVFGMPREAILRGGATHVATLLRMPQLIGAAFERLAAGQTVRAGT